jgi:hypothetical protein
MVSGGYLVGYISQGIGAPALGAVVTANGLMTGLLTGAIAFSAVFAVSLAGAVLVSRSARAGLPTKLPAAT